MNSPKTGLKKTTTTTTPAGGAAKSGGKTRSAQQAADSFARGNVTLGQTLGMTQAQKDMLRQRAYAMLNEQRLDAAEPMLEGLVVLDPFDPWTLTALGSIKLDREQTATALALLERAVLVSPLDVTARALRAEARAKSGDVAGAIEDITSLQKADANLPAIKRVRALGAAIAASGETSGLNPAPPPAAGAKASTTTTTTPGKPAVAAKPTTTATATTTAKPTTTTAPASRPSPHAKAPPPEETSALRKTRSKLP